MCADSVYRATCRKTISLFVNLIGFLSIKVRCFLSLQSKVYNSNMAAIKHLMCSKTLLNYWLYGYLIKISDIRMGFEPKIIWTDEGEI